MERRPIYVSFVGWFLVLLGALCFLSLAWDFTLLKNTEFAEVFLGKRLPPHERWFLNELDFAIMIVTGKFMLDGENWARIVYVIWTVLWLGFCGYKDPDLMLFLPNLLFHGIAMLLLFLPRANRYFLARYKWP
jgi:hypothetical protein